MNSISFPIQLVTFIRRLVNVISTISLTNHYLFPRIQVENRLSEHQAKPGIGPYSPLLDPSFNNRWDWLRPGYKFSWSSIVKPIWSSNSKDSLQLGLPREHIAASTSNQTRDSISPSETSLHASEALDFQSSISVSITKVVAASSSPNVDPTTQDVIHRLMSNPTLFDPIRTPRYPIVLCHGLYGFDARGPSAFPSLRYHYWSNVLAILKKKIGAEVIVTAVPGTGSIAARAEALDRILQQRAIGRGVNLMAHSMGGLDCRHLITHIKPTDYVPLSLTSISTPHRGSPFMDWCAQNLGLGRRTDSHEPECNNASSNSDSDKHEFILSLASLPSSFTTLILSYLDSPAYANLTTSYLNDIFNPSTPDDPRVKYFSVVSRIDEMNIWHPLWLPKMVLDDAERKAKESLKARMGGKYSGEGVPPWEQDDQWGNDGLVTVQSARWGEFLGILEGCDHWDIRSWRGSLTEFSIGLPSVSIPLSGLTHRAGADGWSLGDWTRFIGAWRKQDKGTEAGLQMSTVVSQADALPLSSLQETKSEREERKQRDETDPVVKASTDKLSAVFDWIVEQVPPPGKPSSPNSQPQSEKPARRDLVTKMDLERFYISLTRKLYDEGL